MIHTEVTADIMRDYIAAHPTLSEAIHEALMQAVGHLYMLNRNMINHYSLNERENSGLNIEEIKYLITI